MSLFNMGDRIVVVHESSNVTYGSGNGRWFQVGMTGTIQSIHSFGIIIQFDGQSRHWTAQPEELALLTGSVAKTRVEMKIKRMWERQSFVQKGQSHA